MLRGATVCTTQRSGTRVSPLSAPPGNRCLKPLRLNPRRRPAPVALLCLISTKWQTVSRNRRRVDPNPRSLTSPTSETCSNAGPCPHRRRARDASRLWAGQKTLLGSLRMCTTQSIGRRSTHAWPTVPPAMLKNAGWKLFGLRWCAILCAFTGSEAGVRDADAYAQHPTRCLAWATCDGARMRPVKYGRIGVRVRYLDLYGASKKRKMLL